MIRKILQRKSYDRKNTTKLKDKKGKTNLHLETKALQRRFKYF